MARRSKKSNSIKVDFTGVEASGNVREGRQMATVDEVEMKTSENSGNDYINWKLKAKGGAIYHTTSLQVQSLWNLRNMLEAMGLEVPEGPLELELDEYAGMEVGVEVEHETYQGKKKPRIIDLFPIEELDEPQGVDEDEEEEEPEATSEDELTADDVNDMSKEELLELAEEEGLKVLAKHKRRLPALKEFIIGELGLEEEAEEEEDEPEEEEKPVRKSRRKSGSKTLKKGATVQFEDDGEDLEGTVLEINTKEGFAVLDVDGDEWEVEIEDIKL